MPTDVARDRHAEPRPNAAMTMQVIGGAERKQHDDQREERHTEEWVRSPACTAFAGADALRGILVGVSEPADVPPRPFSAAPSEVEALLGALHRNRRTFAWKTGGLNAEAMRRTLGPSTLTLGGLVKHLALVEDHYFTHQLLGRDYPAVWAPMAGDDDWEWTSAANDSPEALRTLWLDAVARSEAAVEEALADGDLDRPLAASNWSETPNLRRVLVDLIEEYARHTGHADLIRESIDGLVGEDAPQ